MTLRPAKSCVIPAVALALAATLLPPATALAAQDGSRPAVSVPNELFTGRMLYERFCAECHGKDLSGVDKKGPPFLHKFYVPGHHGDRSFYVATLKGVKAHHWTFGDMKPVEKVREPHVGHIVRYVRYVQRALGMF